MSITNLDPERIGQRRAASVVHVPTRNTAVYIDLENLFGGYAGSVQGVAVAAIIEQVARQGAELGYVSEIAVMKAYANWADPRLGVYRREMMEQGIEPVQVFSFGDSVKNAADIELVTDALSTAYESPFIEVFVIVSADGGFVPLARRLHAMGRTVIVVSVANRKVNKLLRSVADECIIVQGAAPTEESRPAKQPTRMSGNPRRTGHTRALAGLTLGAPRTRQELRTEIGRIVGHENYTDWHRSHATFLDQSGVALNAWLLLLDEIDPRWRSHVKRWFPAAKQAFAYALADTDWRFANVDGVGPVIVPADSPHAAPGLTDDDLPGWAATTEALARLEPPIRLTSIDLLLGVVEFVDEHVSTERDRTLSFDTLYEAAAEALDEYPAAEVRSNLITLANSGVLVTDDATAELADRRYHRDGERPLELVASHVRSSLAAYEWPEANEVTEALEASAS